MGAVLSRGVCLGVHCFPTRRSSDLRQWARRGDPRVLLAQGAGGGVARVGERGLALLDHQRVERAERLDRQEDLAAHLDARDRKSTRLNSSHLVISYAVFCLKKKITE